MKTRIEVAAFPFWSYDLSLKVQRKIAEFLKEQMDTLGYTLEVKATEPRLESEKYWIDLEINLVPLKLPRQEISGSYRCAQCKDKEFPCANCAEHADYDPL